MGSPVAWKGMPEENTDNENFPPPFHIKLGHLLRSVLLRLLEPKDEDTPILRKALSIYQETSTSQKTAVMCLAIWSDTSHFPLNTVCSTSHFPLNTVCCTSQQGTSCKHVLTGWLYGTVGEGGGIFLTVSLYHYVHLLSEWTQLLEHDTFNSLLLYFRYCWPSSNRRNKYIKNTEVFFSIYEYVVNGDQTRPKK